MTNLLLEPEQFAGSETQVIGDAYRHLFRSLRLRVGDELRVVDGQGQARRAAITGIGKEQATLELGEPLESLEPTTEVHLFVGFPRPQRASWLVEKTTELGVAAIHFLVLERSARSPGSAAADRLTRVARAAVEQCGRARLPEISVGHQLSELPRLMASFLRRVVLDPEGGAIALGAPDVAADGIGADGVAADGAGGVAVLIGPEGGFSDEELAFAISLGCVRQSLGLRILRVETAAVAAVACWTRG